jgi:hypothetical protein
MRVMKGKIVILEDANNEMTIGGGTWEKMEGNGQDCKFGVKLVLRKTHATKDSKQQPSKQNFEVNVEELIS